MAAFFRVWFRGRHTFVGIVLLTLVTAGCSKQERQESSPSSSPAPASAAPAAPPISPVSADVNQIIQKARAAIGPEGKLNAIQALLMTGSVLDDKNQPVGALQVLYQKPGRMRSVVQTSNQIATEGSDGLVGWTLNVGKDNSKKFGLLPADTEKQNYYSALENLYFYRAAELIPGSKVTDEGEVQYRGGKCRKLSFQYPDGTTYVRYLDSATGQLRGTVVLPTGDEFVESGTQNVEGIIFPVTVNNYNKDGKLVQTVTFDHVYLNPKIGPGLFDLPDLKTLMAPVVTAKPATTAASGSGTPAPAKPAGTSIDLPSPQTLFKQK